MACNSKSEKRYKSPLYLTDKGVKIGEIIDLKVKDILNVVSNELSTDELITFYKGLNLISGNLEKFCQQYDKNKKTN